MVFGASLIHSVIICSTVFLGSGLCQALLQQEMGYSRTVLAPAPLGALRWPGTHRNVHCHGDRRHEGY